jgi:hypothetical protein
MPEELLAAMLQAEESEASVRSPALLRIARVLAKTDQAAAERLLDRGLTLLAELPDDQKAAIAPQATCLAACVAPDRAFALLATMTDPIGTEKFLFDMVRTHPAPAIEYLTRWSEDGQFPYGAASHAMGYAKDDDTRREILRSGLRAWHRRTDRTWYSFDSLLQLLRFHWGVLPDDEGREVLRSLVGIMRELPDARLNGRFGGARGTVTFSSQRSSLLFALLGPMKRLDPALADAVMAEHPEVRRAAEIYPFGYDIEVDRRVEPRPSAEAMEQWETEWASFALGAELFRIQDERRGDFRESFDHALRALARDTDHRQPNPAPRECWPSAEDFRTILYAAGRYEGAGAARLLDRIPDPALRLFAQIEFAAALAGLDQLGGITREPGHGS